jgi:spermidine/putrescine transport system permease protein
VWLLAFFLVPLALVWAMSFGEKAGLIDIAYTWTLDNYARAVDPLYLGVFAKSLWFAGLTTLICLAVGFVVAMAISFGPTRWRVPMLILVMLPFWTNLLIRTYALIAVFRTRGVVNGLLEQLWEWSSGLLALVGLSHLELLGPRFEPLELLYNNFAVVTGLVYVHLPFMVLPLYAALERMDHSYVEASLDLGASHFRTIVSVMIPLAMPGIITGVIITFVPALGSFLIPDLLGGTDSQMIANVIERQFKSANDWPFGAALSFLLMYVTFIAIALRALWSARQRQSRGTA